MTINPVKGQTVAAYQGSEPTTYKKTESSVKTEKTEAAIVKSDSLKVEDSQETVKKPTDSYSEETKSVNRTSEPEPDEIKKIIDQLNRHANSGAVFGYHEATHRITIKIIDKETDEVIKEFPPEKMLDMIAKTWELAGLLVDERR